MQSKRKKTTTQTNSYIEPFEPKKQKRKSSYSAKQVSPKNKRRKKKQKHFSEVFLSFLCSLFLFILLVLVVIKLTLMSSTFALQQAEKSNFYDELTESVNEKLVDLGLGSGIASDDVLKSFVKEANVRTDMSSFIKTAYLGETYNVPEGTFKTDIKQRLQDYAQSNNLQIAEENGKSALDTFADDAFSIYTETVTIPLLPLLGKKIVAVETYLMIAIIVFASLLLIFIIILSYLSNHWFHRVLRYLGTAGLGTSLMLIVAPLLVLKSKQIDNLAITYAPLYNYASTFVHSFFEMFIRFGIYTAILSLIFIVISEFSRKKNSHRR